MDKHEAGYLGRLRIVERQEETLFSTHQGCDHIFFVGFMGAGKTTVARNLGTLFKRRFMDTDKLVARYAKTPVAQLYKERGVEGYRLLETEVLKTLRREKSCLISCGDGIVEREENLQLFKEMGKVVFLDISLQDALLQIKAREHRPLLGSYDQTRDLYLARRPLYASVADYAVEVSSFEFEQVAYRVGELLWDEGLL